MRTFRFLRTWLSDQGGGAEPEADPDQDSRPQAGARSGSRSGPESSSGPGSSSGRRSSSKGRDGGDSAPDREPERDIEIEAGGESISATLFLPSGARPPRSSAIVLHGVTRPGRRHPDLVRFCRSLAAAGTAAVVPEIREWTELRLAPERVVPVVRAALEWLEASEPGGRRRPSLAGFSFGGPQVIRAAADPGLADRIAAVVAFGSYLDVERTVRFQLLGEHEWEGRRLRVAPDPYGRWIMGANHLTDVPELPGATEAARALERLAMEAGDRRIPAADPAMDPVRDALRDALGSDARRIFDLFAPAPEVRAAEVAPATHLAGGPGGADDPARRTRLERMARDLAGAALRVSPELSAAPVLEHVRCPVYLVHGRSDRLIPFSETLRLARAFPSSADVTVRITGLFAHTRGSPLRSKVATAWEALRFLRMLRGILRLL